MTRIILRKIIDANILVLGLILMCYTIHPVENIIFAWFEENSDYPGNHIFTTIGATFINTSIFSITYSIYTILTDIARSSIDNRHQQSQNW